ncbi:MAG: hypothetical protein NT069_21390, partial [Planctomycetota bacterium]|nr:hypothetical protein [Planctomycetota bacterium]
STVLRPLDAPASPKGWRASALVANKSSGFGVALCSETGLQGGDSTIRQAALGILGADATTSWSVEAGASVVLAQQIRDPQAGRFVVTLSVRGDGSSREFYDEVFLKNFRCRLCLFQFTEPAKSAKNRRELATVDFRPTFHPESSTGFETFVVEKYLGTPGGNFSFGLGIGMAVIVERSTPGVLDLPAHAAAFLRVDEATVRFEGQVA